jgi:hypothetical protein
VLVALVAAAVAGAAVFAGLRRQRDAAVEQQLPAAVAVRLPETPLLPPAPQPPAPAQPAPQQPLVAAREPMLAAAPAAAGPAAPPAPRRLRALRRPPPVREPEVPSGPLPDDDPEPVPAPVAAATAPTLPPPPPPAPPPTVFKDWDVSRATVSVVEVTTSSAISVAKIRAGVRLSLLQACYQAALRASDGPASGVASLHIQIDVNGAVRAASLTGGEFLPAMKPCLERAIRAARVKDIDTGDAAATIVMKFQAGA